MTRYTGSEFIYGPCSVEFRIRSVHVAMDTGSFCDNDVKARVWCLEV